MRVFGFRIGLMMRTDDFVSDPDAQPRIGGLCWRWDGVWHGFMFKRCPNTKHGKRYFRKV